jgi:MEMO1 family protein
LPLWKSDTLWVISSDFTHFGHSFGYVPFTGDVEHKLKELDMGAVKKILALDSKGFSDYIEDTGATICGAAPIEILLKTIELANCADSIKTELLECTNSGEISGDFSHCVGYSSIAFCDK